MKTAQQTQNLFISEVYVNDTDNCFNGQSGWFETFTNDTFELFKSLRKKYGKPSKMYVDTVSGEAKQIGWIFTKTVKYEDCNEKYVCSVWVEVSTTKPVESKIVENINYPFN